MLADALLIIDMQNAVCFQQEKIYHFDELVTLINHRIDEYDKNHKPIIFVQHSDKNLLKNTKEWEIIDHLQKNKADYFIDKHFSSAFYQTELDNLLKQLNIENLEICGAETPFCIEATLQSAHLLGYKLQMKKGATTTNYTQFMTAENTIKHYETIWGYDPRFLTLFE
ncbi:MULTISPECIES: isochorismatase family protein [Rodentibacter]|uniref:isochorismatase family protein n=1 Tax=Rodentibacter TaxID=1960084 RepID=UPI001CFC6238|nr:isochorismatase family protein [Rodentibacter sp. JRC1]GJI56780.1 amidase [Rodentibacter sp. JRC1]